MRLIPQVTLIFKSANLHSKKKFNNYNLCRAFSRSLFNNYSLRDFSFGNGLVSKQCIVDATRTRHAFDEEYLAKVDPRLKQIIFVFGEIMPVK